MTSEPVDPFTSDEATRDGEDAYALSPRLESALVGFLGRETGYDETRLRVGRDLKPATCERLIGYALAKTPKDPPTIAQKIRWERGHAAGRLIVAALKHAGHEVVEEVPARAFRPSAWAYADGHGDALLVADKHLYEVKAPGVDAWRAAGRDARRLVRDDYRYQLSRYLHDLKREGRAVTASWVFADWEGRYEPREVPLTDDLLVPLEEIVAIEWRTSNLVGDGRAERERPARTLVVEVLKGRAQKVPKRTVRGKLVRYQGCDFCDYAETCKPGPAVIDGDPTPEQAAQALARAEAEWAAGVLDSPIVTEFSDPGNRGMSDEARSLVERVLAAPEPGPRMSGGSVTVSASLTVPEIESGSGVAPSAALETAPPPALVPPSPAAGAVLFDPDSPEF